MRQNYYLSVCLLMLTIFTSKANVINVKATGEDATRQIQAAIEEAKQYKGKPLIIRFEPGNYNISRKESSKIVYYISNTASESQNPDPTKHIGLWIQGLKNVTIDGQGALLVTHGEMTSFVIDGCENIKLKNIAVTAADPSVTEMTITERGDNYLVGRAHPTCKYKIEDGKLTWIGEEWSLSGGIAQCFDPKTNYSLRTNSPMNGYSKAIELEPGLIRINYPKDAPQCKPGQTYQMRDGVRDEVAGFIHKSKNITLEDFRFNFLGNFGIVGQYSENITYNRLYCEPELEGGRTCAGFADFVQMSGCKGKISITNSRFEGAHDDPINIHGTHLQVIEVPALNQLKVKFMHHESYGFDAFFAGDEVELIHPNTLMALQKAKVKRTERINNREILITLDRNITNSVKEVKNLVVENTSWTPEVEIRNNYFSRIPTRGILVSTRRKVVIEENTFFRMPMSGILIANDARSWYESGPVHDVTIRHNQFIECGSPVIYIEPENNENGGFVHRNISITANRFLLNNRQAISAKSVSGLTVSENLFLSPTNDTDEQAYVRVQDCEKVKIERNRVEQRK